jgi:hypothetical protein
MAAMVIFLAISGGAVVFMLCFFVAIFRESHRTRVSRIVRLSTGEGFLVENSEVMMESTSDNYVRTESPGKFVQLAGSNAEAASGNSFSSQKDRTQAKVS